MESCCLMDIVSVRQDKKSSGDWLHNNVNVLNAAEMVKW